MSSWSGTGFSEALNCLDHWEGHIPLHFIQNSSETLAQYKMCVVRNIIKIQTTNEYRILTERWTDYHLSDLKIVCFTKDGEKHTFRAYRTIKTWIKENFYSIRGAPDSLTFEHQVTKVSDAERIYFG